jgi:hypothetical protein
VISVDPLGHCVLTRPVVVKDARSARRTAAFEGVHLELAGGAAHVFHRAPSSRDILSPVRVAGRALSVLVAMACLVLAQCSRAQGVPEPPAMDASPDGDRRGNVDASGEAATIDAGSAADVPDTGAGDASSGDAGTTCYLTDVGVTGTCLTAAGCDALAGHVSTPGDCSESPALECCTLAPNVADNPPVPAGWAPLPQASVTSDIATWAVSILHDPTTYPMFSTSTRTFGALDVLARVEWHPPDFQTSATHRGVTLYERAD